MALLKAIISFITVLIFNLSLMPGIQLPSADLPETRSADPEVVGSLNLLAAPAANAVSQVSLSSFGGSRLDRVTGSDAKNGICTVCGVSESRDGDFAAAGATRPFGFIRRYDSNGSLTASAYVTASGLSVNLSDVCTLRNGGAVVCGYTYSSGDSNVKTTSFISEYSPSLELLWTETLEGSNNITAQSVSTSLDGFVLGGQTASVDGEFEGCDFFGAPCAFLARYKIIQDPDTGERSPSRVWLKTISGEATSEITDVEVDSSNNIFVCVSTLAVGGNYASFDGLLKNSLDCVVLRYNAVGSLQWYYTLASEGRDYFNCVVPDNSGGCLAAGTSVKTGAGISTPLGGTFSGVNYVSGTDGYAVKLTPAGALSWCKPVAGNGEDYITSAVKLGSGYVVGGYSTSYTREFSVNNGGYDGFADFITSSGAKTEMLNLGGTGNDRVVSLSEASGNLVISGISVSQDLFFEGMNTYAYVDDYSFISNDISDCFIAVYS